MTFNIDIIAFLNFLFNYSFRYLLTYGLFKMNGHFLFDQTNFLYEG